MATTAASPHILNDLPCPHCHKKNSVAITPMAETSNAGLAEIKCPHCQQPWEQKLPGQVMAAAFSTHKNLKNAPRVRATRWQNCHLPQSSSPSPGPTTTGL